MKTLSFVIPVYNEEKRIEKTLAALSEGFSFGGFILEKVIFVDDGSTDKTISTIKDWIKNQSVHSRHPSEILRSTRILESKSLRMTHNVAKRNDVTYKVISYSPNRGKGFAVRQGMLASNSDYTLLFDADMSTSLSEFKKLISHLQQGTQVVIGTRKNGHSTVIKHQPIYRELLGRGFTLLSNIILNTWITDFTCGFKLFSRIAKDDIFSQAKINRWSYDAEIVFLAKKLGYKLQEQAVTWSNDEQSKVNLRKDLPQTLFDLLSIRLSNLQPAWIPSLRQVKKPAISPEL